MAGWSSQFQQSLAKRGDGVGVGWGPVPCKSFGKVTSASSEAPLHHLSCPSVHQYVSYITIFYRSPWLISYHQLSLFWIHQRWDAFALKNRVPLIGLSRSRYHLSTCRELSPVSSFSCILAHLANGNRGAVRSSHIWGACSSWVWNHSLSFFAPFTRSTQIVDSVTEYGRFLAKPSRPFGILVFTSLFDLVYSCLNAFEIVWLRPCLCCLRVHHRSAGRSEEHCGTWAAKTTWSLDCVLFTARMCPDCATMKLWIL